MVPPRERHRKSRAGAVTAVIAKRVLPHRFEPVGSLVSTEPVRTVR